MTRRQSYFAKQKLIGLGMMIASILVSWFIKDVTCICLISIPLGLCLMFTKRMILVDSYYRELEEKMERTQ